MPPSALVPMIAPNSALMVDSTALPRLPISSHMAAALSCSLRHSLPFLSGDTLSSTTSTSSVARVYSATAVACAPIPLLQSPDATRCSLYSPHRPYASAARL
jgi:hypothetical protein